MGGFLQCQRSLLYCFFKSHIYFPFGKTFWIKNMSSPPPKKNLFDSFFVTLSILSMSPNSWLMESIWTGAFLTPWNSTRKHWTRSQQPWKGYSTHPQPLRNEALPSPLPLMLPSSPAPFFDSNNTNTKTVKIRECQNVIFSGCSPLIQSWLSPKVQAYSLFLRYWNGKMATGNPFVPFERFAATILDLEILNWHDENQKQSA